MNANELADFFDGHNGINLKEASAMLRQQYAEIEALKIKHDVIACSSCPCGLLVGGKMKTKLTYRDLEFPVYGLIIRFIRDEKNNTIYVGRTTDAELDEFEKIILKKASEK